MDGNPKIKKKNLRHLIDKTEIILHNQNPNWAKSFLLDYVFEITQTFKVEVLYIYNEKTGSGDSAGSATFEMGELMGSKNCILIVSLVHDKIWKKGGQLIVRSEQVSETNDNIFLQFSGRKLDFNRWFGMSGSPFLRFYRPRMTPHLKLMMERGGVDGAE
jgi:hypothetical protein